MSGNNIIIGTAGHIDHGKTTLIKALTGAETDRLQEEKQRGISIELGFAGFTLANGDQVGIIDVPGHEKFIKNMLAGAGGVDFAILVVAADEGMMPQSDEHLAILDLLGVKHGLIALTKIDQVDEEWRELVELDTRDKVEGTFLENAPIMPVSAISGEGINELKEKIAELLQKMPVQPNKMMPYLPVDRVFTLQGMGTIVTGTLIKGEIQKEQQLMIYPQKLPVRVRSLQVHNDQVEKVESGQRVGINLTGVDKAQLQRGDVLAEPGRLIATKYFDASLQLLVNSPMIVKHDDRIRLHLGAREVIGRIYLLDKEELGPGERGLVQFRLENEVVARTGEKFILRRYSPMQTIGGGKILVADPPYHKMGEQETIKELEQLAAADQPKLIELIIKNCRRKLVDLDYLKKRTSLHAKYINEIINQLENKKIIINLGNQQHPAWLAQETINILWNSVKELLVNFQQMNPLRPGISKEQLRSELDFEIDSKAFNQLLLIWSNEGKIKQRKALISLADFQINLSEDQKKLKEEIINLYNNNYFKPPETNNLKDEFEQIDTVEELISLLEREGELIRLTETIYFSRTAISKASKLLIEYLTENGEISLAEFRDLLDSTRKYVLPLLEYFDQQNLTVRRGDLRLLGKKGEAS